MNGETIEYDGLTKPQKLHLIKYVRNVYGYNTCVRDIIRGLHKGIVKDGCLTGISTNITTIYNEYHNSQKK